MKIKEKKKYKIKLSKRRIKNLEWALEKILSNNNNIDDVVWKDLSEIYEGIKTITR